ncbi:MAG: DUF2142 domain-containing protein [Chloroflexi bacterium]|nr:DUF2142 domain-containing protein [Chloroflexota bacterium]
MKPRLILFLGLALSAWCFVFTPLWQIPDEPQHYQLARLVADLGRWPTLSDVWSATQLGREVYSSLVRNRFWEIRAHRPPPPSLWADTAPDVLLPPIAASPGYYMVAAGALRLAGGAGVDSQLRVLRALSVLLGLAELFFVFRLARAAFPHHVQMQLAALCLVAFLPMRAYMAAGANSDTLAALVSAAALCAMASWADAPLTPARGLCVGLLVAVSLLTKRTTLFLIPTCALFLLLTGRGAGQRRSVWWLGAGVAAAGACAPLALWLLVRPALVAPGQVWPYPGAAPGGFLAIRPEWLARPFSAEAWTPAALWGYARGLSVAFASFWGAFGWLTVRLGVGWYAALAALSGAAGLGLVRGLRRAGGPLSGAQILVAVAAALAVLQVVGVAVAQGIPQQGRYLLPAAGPIACCLVAGWSQWLPARAQRRLPLLVGGALLLLNAAAWGFYIWPAFHGPA